jgi:hypothetical protein
MPESIMISEKSGVFCLSCCGSESKRIIPFTSVQSIGISVGGCLATLCCSSQTSLWIATVASGLRFPHFTLVDKEDAVAAMEVIQNTMGKQR